MNGIAIYFYIGIIILGGNTGIPMGMAPGPEDPLMAQIAPDQCTFYASWSGVAETDPLANPTEKWMSQPKTSQAISKFRKALRGYVLARGKNFDPLTKLANRMLVEVADVGSVEPAAVYIDELDVKNKAVNLRGAVVVSLGGKQDVVQARFDALYEAAEQHQGKVGVAAAIYKAVEFDGERRIELAGPVGSIPMTATIRGKYFILGIGKGTLDEVARNATTPPPKWLADMRNRLIVDRIGSVGFVNVEAGRDVVLPRTSGIMNVWNETEILEGLQSVGWVSGLDKKGFLSRTEVTADNSKGILSVFNLKPIPQRFLNGLPADSTAGVATRVSTKRILELVKNTARRAGQEEPLTDSLKQFQKVTGVSLEEELLAAVGDYVHAYYKLNIQEFNKGWVLSVRIEDEMSFPAIFDQLNRGLKKWIEDMDGHTFKVEKNGLHETYSVTTPRNRNDFAWTVIDDEWLFAATANEIKKHVAGQPARNQYVTDPDVVEAYEFGDRTGFGGPVMMVNLNLTDIFEAVRPFAGAILASEERISRDFDFKWSDIPPIDELVNEVRPNFLFVFKTETGFQLLQRQTYPGASPPVSAAALAVGALPVQMADMISREKLKLLGRAHLEFEKQHKHLCAAQSMDANGKPLLSWRVHLLPFLGQEELYRNFRLNEAWNSTHNYALLGSMPDVYRHPSLKLDPNKTVYLVPVRRHAAFGTAPTHGESPPQGMQLTKITDDRATTAMILELNKAQQVFWTEPKDFTRDGDDVRADARNVRDSNRFGIVMCDGTVRFLSSYLPAQTLNRVLDFDDGQEVKLPEYWFLR